MHLTQGLPIAKARLLRTEHRVAWRSAQSRFGIGFIRTCQLEKKHEQP
jgi:hypothetical protein